ncbi:hypothetical protein HS088_TW06G00123 [Tripterygium wilfordii]|uniref:C2H2-type domain-containing protein n=1 Tax=Tripterygium wilfordii TaxID=458696 RepID=A0A7J7DI37_TRIWF|nr:uncharacterized protein LOC120000033 [Tripterygium wilfordii]KAF5745958.1 hypothetical protein HS088_TW06G00123 [Tripterygium wilfordii]
MAGRMDLGFSKTSSSSLREQMARTTLHNVRSQGHTYVELREDGRRFIFFCTLCLAPCYSDSVLFEHLKGSLHTERLATAKVTLLKPNPWPFNDGVHFFRNSTEIEKPLAISNGKRNMSVEIQNDGNSLSIVKYGENVKGEGNKHGGLDGVCDEDLDSTRTDDDIAFSPSVEDLNGNGGNDGLLIPDVLIKDKISNLKVSCIGFGQIAARFCEKDDGSHSISRIWCEWLGGKGGRDESAIRVPEHDFAVVTFSYNYELGRKDLLEDVKLLLTSNPMAESENGGGFSRKRKKSFSDPEDVSESLSNQCDSSGEESSASTGASMLLLDRFDDQLLHTRSISNKHVRREVRRQQRIAAERMCDICQHKMLPEKDVAALLNMKTGKLACSSRNVNGAFHVFHTSCLINWILLCENEIFTNQLVAAKVGQKSKRKNGIKNKEMAMDGESMATKTQINSLFCPECQGSGIIVEGDELEEPSIRLSEMFKYKIRISDAQRAWMKSPELLQNCSTGFRFPSPSEKAVQEKVVPLKVIHFYRAGV